MTDFKFNDEDLEIALDNFKTAIEECKNLDQDMTVEDIASNVDNCLCRKDLAVLGYFDDEVEFTNKESAIFFQLAMMQ